MGILYDIRKELNKLQKEIKSKKGIVSSQEKKSIERVKNLITGIIEEDQEKEHNDAYRHEEG